MGHDTHSASRPSSSVGGPSCTAAAWPTSDAVGGDEGTSSLEAEEAWSVAVGVVGSDENCGDSGAPIEGITDDVPAMDPSPPRCSMLRIQVN